MDVTKELEFGGQMLKSPAIQARYVVFWGVRTICGQKVVQETTVVDIDFDNASARIC